MMADAWRPDYLSAAGHPLVKTPHMDALVEEGVMCDRSYCAAAQCAPSRTSFVTGLYPHTHGVLFNHIEMPDCHKTMGHYFSRAGYKTAWIGKGHNYPPRVDYGFDVLKLSDGGNTPIWDDDYFLWLHDQGVSNDAIQQLWDDVWNFHQTPFGQYRRNDHYMSPVPEDQVMTAWITWESRKFIEESVSKDEPFCVFASHHAPQNHDDLPEPYYSMYDPKDVPEPVNGKLTPKLARIIASYAGKVSMLDKHVGDLVETLKEQGVMDNTIIVLTADHACFLGESGMQNKMWTREYDSRIPLIVWNPKRFAQGMRTDAFISNIDVLPTMLDAIGEPIPEAIQGISQLDVLKGQKDTIREVLLCESGEAGKQRKGVWHGDWKLLYRTGVPKIEMYNLRKDPYELNDLGEDPEFRKKRDELIHQMFLEYVTTERYPNPMPEIEVKRQAGWLGRV